MPRALGGSWAAFAAKRGTRQFVSKRVPLLAVNPEHPEPHRIGQAVSRLVQGQVIGYPTDTVYGFGADIEHRQAIDKLYGLRKLDPKKPLSLVCADQSEVSRYAAVSDECFRFMKRVLPGPYTFVLRATRQAPRLGQNKRRAVGIRIPANPVARALVERLGRPIVSTSVPLEGEPYSDPVELAERYGGREVSLFLDGGLAPGDQSTVIDWSEDEPEVLRLGAGDISDLIEG